MNPLFIQFVVGAAIGFCLYCVTAPRQGENKEYSLIIPIPWRRGKACHIHHHLYLLMLSPLAILCRSPVAYGFCIGGIVQSFVWYTDFFDIIVPQYQHPNVVTSYDDEDDDEALAIL